MTRFRALLWGGAWAGLALSLATLGSVETLSAVEALRRGQYGRALEASRTDLAASPQSVPALLVLIRALLETGAHAEAEDTVRNFLSKNPKAADAWNAISLTMMAASATRQATIRLKSVLDLRKSFTVTFAGLGCSSQYTFPSCPAFPFLCCPER